MKRMLEERDGWIAPEELAESERRIRIACRGEADINSDFGSYKRLKEGNETTGIKMHNAVGGSANHWARCFYRIVRELNIPTGDIADVGCGAGFITHEVKLLFPQSTVHGFDISEDAIEYAKQHFPGIYFSPACITPGMTFSQTYDIIYGREFYPFTRTSSLSFQYSFIEFFLRNLRDGGALILGLAKSEKSIFHNLDTLKRQTDDRMKVILEPNRMLYRLLPSFFLAQSATRIIKGMLGKKNSYFLVFRKR